MPAALSLESRAHLAPAPERELRRHIDRGVSRALVDGDYASRLLSDPTVVVESHGCPPQQYRSLRSIRAADVVDFAQQAYALFWRAEPKSVHLEEDLPRRVG